MNVNLAADGIIAQTIRHLAVHGEPFTDETGGQLFYRYIGSMGETPGAYDYKKLGELQTRTIGRIATTAHAASDNHYATTQLAMLSESVEAMPDHDINRPGIKRIGSISIENRTMHGTNGHYAHGIRSGLKLETAILTSGDVIATSIMLETCNTCPERIDEELDLLHRLGLDALRLETLPPVHSSYVGSLRMQSNIQFGEQQINGLQQFLDDTFPRQKSL